MARPRDSDGLLPYERTLATAPGRAKEAVRRLIAAAVGRRGAVVRVATGEPAVALTFDDGPDPRDTPPMLDLLEARGARATFFMVGARARRNPDLVARVAAAGHAVANHSFDHTSFRRLDAAARRRQLADTAAALRPHGVALFRPPYGELSRRGRADVRRAGHELLCWDIVAMDWADDPPATLVARVLRRLRRGSIVLFHDTLWSALAPAYRDRAPTRAAVARLVDELGAAGFRCLTVPELLALGRPVRWPWSRRAHPESWGTAAEEGPASDV